MSCCSKPSSPGAVSKAAFADVTHAPTPKSASGFCGAQKQSRLVPPLTVVGLPKSRAISPSRTPKPRAISPSRTPKPRAISPSRTRDSSDGDSSSCYSFGSKEEDHVDYLHYSIEDKPDDHFTKPFSTSKYGKRSRKGSSRKRKSPSYGLLVTSPHSPKEGLLVTSSHSPKEALLVTSSSPSPKEGLLVTSSHSPKEGVLVTSSQSPKEALLVTPSTSPKETIPIASSHLPKEGLLITSSDSPNEGLLIISPESPNHGQRRNSPNPRQSPRHKTPKFSQSKRNRQQLPHHVQSPSRRQHLHCPSSPTQKRSKPVQRIPEALGAAQELKEIPKLTPSKHPNHLSSIPSKSPTTGPKDDNSPSRPGSCVLCRAQTPKSKSHRNSPTNGQPPSISESPFTPSSVLTQTQRDSHQSPSTFVPSPQQSQSTRPCSPSLNVSPSTLSKALRTSPHESISPSKLAGSCFPFAKRPKHSNPSVPTAVPGPQQSKSTSNPNPPRTLNALTSTSSKSIESCSKHGQAPSRSAYPFPRSTQNQSCTHTTEQGHQQLKSISNWIPEISRPSISTSSQYRKPSPKHGQTLSRPASPFHSSTQTQSTLQPTPSISPEKPRPIRKPSPNEIPKTSTSLAFLTPIMVPKTSKSTQTSSPSGIRNASPNPKISKPVTKLNPSKITMPSTSITSLAQILAPGSQKSQSTQTSFILSRNQNTSPVIVSEAPRTSPRPGLFPSIPGGLCFSFGKPPKLSHPSQPNSVPGPQQLKSSSSLNTPRISKAQTSISSKSLESCPKHGPVQSRSVSPFRPSTQNQSSTHTMVQGHQQSKSISDWIPEISNPSTSTSSHYLKKPCPKHGQAVTRPASPSRSPAQSQSYTHPTSSVVKPQDEKPETTLETSPSKIPKASTLVGFPTPNMTQDLQNSQSTQKSSQSRIPNTSPSLQEVPRSSPSDGMSPPIISAGSCFSFAIYAPKYSDQSIFTSTLDPKESNSNFDSPEYSHQSISTSVPDPKESNSNSNPPQASTSISVAFPKSKLAPDRRKLELIETSNPSGIVSPSTSTSSKALGTSNHLASSCFHFARPPKHSHSSLPPSTSDDKKSKSIISSNRPEISNASTSNSLEYPETSLKQGQVLSGSTSSSSHFSRVSEESYPTPQIALTDSAKKSTMDTVLSPVEPTITLLHYDHPQKKLANSCCPSAGKASIPVPSGSPTALPEQGEVPSRSACTWFCRSQADATSTKHEVQERGLGRARRLWARLWNRPVSRGSECRLQNLESPLPSISSASKGPGNLPYEKDERWIDYSDTRAFVIFGFNVGIIIFLTYFVDLLHDGKKNPDSVKETDSSYPYLTSSEKAERVCNFAIT